MKRYLIPMLVSASLWMAVFLAESLSFPAIGTAEARTADSDKSLRHMQELSAVVAVLEDRIGDEGLLEKTSDKLSRMSDAQLRLLASLCERIPEEGDTAGADVAFLLITVLIILA